MKIISMDESTGKMEIELTDDEKNLLLEYAINNILRNYLDSLTNECKGQE